MAYLFKTHSISTGQNCPTSMVQMWALSITSKAVTLYDYAVCKGRNKPGTTYILNEPSHYQMEVFFQFSHGSTTWAVPCWLPDGGTDLEGCGVLGNSMEEVVRG